ncbi:hypothetical protein SAMN02745857_03470 [Andreprevotia lacus DSM 23236]|jgi:hypothetical protein|uniref:Uncharacterized protein n=1 Tax=Andreprevotia lacus DSM 23236 TaxID=1121001 RepID=A0A1W1XZH4_9NEIS|nr:hypothetical protein [Andreprevotia lacus]SMC28898.1 hypothetical protein SAMN02745857_03470 [Andreprevotia lacus DSM 23236]
MYLPDPRLYPRVNAQNPVIRALMSWLTEADGNVAVQKRAALAGLFEELILSNDNAGLNAALTQAPSQDAYKALWALLREAVENPPADAACWAVPFAIPVILVAGAKGEVTLPHHIDPAAVRATLQSGGLIAEGADVWLAGDLLTPDQLAGISPPQLARWRDQLQDTAAGLPRAFEATPLKFKDEAVFQRYLVGVAIQQRGAAMAIQLNAQPGQWTLALQQKLGEALKTPGVTLFPIPRVPLSWLAALETGRVTQLETRLQVATSNALRSIRSNGHTPVVTIASHEGGEIRISYSMREDKERWEGFVWRLAPLDSAERIHHFADELFRECRQDDIQLIEAVQPDLDTDGLPFFVTAHIPPVTQQ